MKIWIFVFLFLPLIGVAYASRRIWQILPLAVPFKVAVMALIVLCFVAFVMNFFLIDKWPMPLASAAYNIGTSSLIVLLYLVMVFGLLDLGRLLHLVPSGFLHDSIKGSVTVLALMAGLFTCAYFNYLHKVRVPIELTTSKHLERPLKIVMMSDLHLGYGNQVEEFNRWVDRVNAEDPDLVLVGGDIIDGHLRPLHEQKVAASFHRMKVPVVACLGNHEFYAGSSASARFYHDAGIKLLVDESITINGINIVSRDDRSNSRRKPLSQLMQGVDTSKYTILLDHQPYDLEQAQQNGIDFQFSGHTHYGQVWPLSWIENLIYEDAFGPLKKGGTQYYVSSGIGIWGGKFRIGTRSEYIVATLTP